MINLLKSRVFWFNIASIAVELTGSLSTVIPPGTTLVAVNIINIILRIVTTQALKDK